VTARTVTARTVTARTVTARTVTARTATARTATGRRRARRRARAAPASGVGVLTGRARAVVSARRPSRHAGSRRPVEAVRVRRYPAPVRQPMLGARTRTAARRAAAGRPAVRSGAAIGSEAAVGPWAAVRGAGARHAIRRSGVLRCCVRSGVGRSRVLRSRVRSRVLRCRVRHRPVWPAGAWHATVARPAVGGSAVRGSAWREPAWLALVRSCLLAEPLPGRHLARTAQQLSVVVFLDVYRSAWPGRIILLVVGGGEVAVVGGVGSGAVAAAISLAPGRTVRVTAEAGVATFHQYLLDLGVQPRRGTFVLTSRV
jgi:hypothetical protein